MVSFVEIMEREQRAGIFDAPRPDTPSYAAYHLEGQAIAIAKAQQQGNLITTYEIFQGMEIVREMDCRWYGLIRPDGQKITLLADNCVEETLEQLRFGQQLTIIKLTEARPDVCFGNEWFPIAAVLLEEKVLYKSPGFDLEAYLANPPQPKQEIISPQPAIKPPEPEPEIRIRKTLPQRLISLILR